MNDVIKLLPDSVANQIAAGEVIQRPASVIKELVENSVDAGATDIQIIIKDAGRTLIQIVDNGCGMSATDARLAFERHATSKIRKADDLFSLHTMGFRGEALPSIAAVAQIDMRTQRKADNIGTRIEISASTVENQQPEACAPGTNLMVKNLFFNLPARRKFLKKDSVELSHIMHEFERLALVNTNIALSITHNNVLLHSLPAANLKQRIVALFGKSLNAALLPVETDTSLVRINGFVSSPEHFRRRNALQFFFVNGRNMRHPYFHKAVMQCFQQLIPADAQPNYFLNFTVDPETIDVNIHPTKNEIKFENEQPIWQILMAAIKESLGRYNTGPAIDFDSTDVPDIPAFNPDADAPHNIDLDRSYNPFSASTPRNWEALYDNFQRESKASFTSAGIGSATGSQVTATSGRSSRLNDIDFESLQDVELKMPEEFATAQLPSLDTPATVTGNLTPSAIMQIRDRFILTPASAGVRIVDQHRAHVAVLYDRFRAMTANHEIASQRLIFPEVICLSPTQHAILTDLQENLTDAGFNLGYLGDTSWSINGLPSVIDGKNPAATVEALLSDIIDSGERASGTVTDSIALAMAKAAAIHPGQRLTGAEMDVLLADLFALREPAYTPDGHRTFTVLSADEIAKLL